MKRLFVGSDHAGMGLKDFVKNYIKQKYKNVEVVDVGTHEKVSCHYPDFAQKIALSLKPEDKSIITCGSGIGIGIAMNKSGIACSTAFNEYTANQCGKYCQVMAMGERVVTHEIGVLMIQAFLQNWAKMQ